MLSQKIILRSAGSDGASPIVCNVAAAGDVPQSSLTSMTWPSGNRTRDIAGSASGFEIPAADNDGPVAVIATSFGSNPVTMKPPMSPAVPEPTFARVEMFASRGAMVAVAPDTRKVWMTSAALMEGPPGCLAVIEHIPMETSVAVVPDTVHTAGVNDSTVTGRPDDELAATPKGASFRS